MKTMGVVSLGFVFHFIPFSSVFSFEKQFTYHNTGDMNCSVLHVLVFWRAS